MCTMYNKHKAWSDVLVDCLTWLKNKSIYGLKLKLLFLNSNPIQTYTLACFFLVCIKSNLHVLDFFPFSLAVKVLSFLLSDSNPSYLFPSQASQRPLRISILLLDLRFWNR